jgi:ceramide glucosyltransferase
MRIGSRPFRQPSFAHGSNPSEIGSLGSKKLLALQPDSSPLVGLPCMLNLAFFVLCIIALLFYGFSIYATLSFSSSVSTIDGQVPPPISILKPLCGLDRDAYDNLATFCQQNYPTYQIIFGVRDWDDPAIAVVEQLIQDFPQVDLRLVVSECVIGTNLKVSNLANLEPYAQYEFMLMSDSDIRVGSDYLQHIIQPMRNPRTGVVTCLYRSRVYGPIAALEALSISTDFHAGVLTARQLGWMNFAMGSSILIRRQVLGEIGGFEAIANFLADDFMLGNLAARAGHRVVLSDYVVEHILATQNLLDLIAHQTRWNRCMRVSNPWGYAGLLFSHGPTLSLFLLLMSGGSPLSWCLFSIVWTARLCMGWMVGVKFLKDKVAAQYLWLVPVRDFLSFGLWCYGFMGNLVVWRGRQFRILKDGTLLALSPNRSEEFQQVDLESTFGNKSICIIPQQSRLSKVLTDRS